MILTKEDQQFLESLAPTETGGRLLTLLENVELYYADIRNISDSEIPVRKDALKILKEALIDRLQVLSGKIDPPDGDEFH